MGNLDWKVRDNELRELFEPFGTIENVRIPRNVAGKSKGVGFVTFSEKVKILHLHDFRRIVSELMNRTI